MATAKRDFLCEIERQVQEIWSSEKTFESDAPDADCASMPEKFMVTFPYPYMNGKLHLGHAFTISKGEFTAAYQRMLGKKILFPFGFHCTGMPIKASADKLCKEMKTYGIPPVVPVDEQMSSTSSLGSKHSKVAAKTGNVKLQWDIMKQLGISEEEIPKFADPLYWMEFFPPLAQKHLISLGCHVDWRRSFITTDANPFYDSFVRWQFNKLLSQNRIKFGKRHTIFSPLDGQPCLDHDRASGEGVEAKEFTVVCLTVHSVPANHQLESFMKDYEIVFGAATLRPETMYGQTNCWVGPEVEYGLFRITSTSTRDRLIVCTRRAALNMSYQGMTPVEGSLDCLGTMMGADLMGVLLKAPLSLANDGVVPVLPMFSVSSFIGTGVVTSVPSNSPADFVALRDLQMKEPLRRKFNLDDAMVASIKVINIIDSPTYGSCSAEAVVQQLNIKSQNDAVALEKAKELVYKDDFYAGRLSVTGEHEGKLIQDVKTIIRDELIAANQAFIYYEPESVVISRSGDECVVALTDQWYLDYGEPTWRALAEKCLSRMNCYGDEVRRQFESTLNWMRQWACSRSFGLGSRMPWDKQYLIESLSDSTIYMAYYSVAHILHQGSLDGSVSPNGITAEDMTDAVWDWIFSDDDSMEMPSDCGISENLMKRMRREFRFWYPMDMRVSGKDLVTNHLTMSIYNHVAIFGERFWPRGMRANGHLLLNSQKMSKSTGNFMTLEDSLAEFGSDATRFALADAGDGVEDANFLKETANSAILRLYNQIEQFQELVSEEGRLRQRSEDEDETELFADRVFAAEIDRAIVDCRAAFEATNFREAIKAGFFELQNARDRYRDATVLHGTVGMHSLLVKRFMEVQAALLYPICPHFSEYVWRVILNHSGQSIVEGMGGFPVPSAAVDEELLAAAHYLQETMHLLRTRLQNECNAGKKGTSKKQSAVAVETAVQAFETADLFVATAYPKWQEDVIAVLKSLCTVDENGKISFAPDDQIVAALKPVIQAGGRVNKKLIPFAMELKMKALVEGALALDRKAKFDELALINDNVDYLTKALSLVRIDVRPTDPSNVALDSEIDPEVVRRQESCLPGAPTVLFKRRSD